MLEVCRGCGRPAYQQEGFISTCGRDECEAALVNVVDPTKIEEVEEADEYVSRRGVHYHAQAMSVFDKMRVHMNLPGDPNPNVGRQYGDYWSSAVDGYEDVEGMYN